MRPHPCVSVCVSVTEFVSYGELQQLWRSLGRLPENLVKIYLAQIALALGKIDDVDVCVVVVVLSCCCVCVGVCV